MKLKIKDLQSIAMFLVIYMEHIKVVFKNAKMIIK